MTSNLIEINVDSPKDVQQKFRRINKAIVSGLVKGLRSESRSLRKHIVKTHLTGAGTDSESNRQRGKLRRRTGEMVRKTTEIKVKDLGGGIFTGGVEFASKYAGVHVGEKGKVTTITPKNSKWLTIPLPPALTRAGVLKKGARDYDDLFFLERKGKNPLLVREKGKGQLEAMFVLSKMVKIRTRIHPKSILASRRNKIIAGLRNAVNDSLRKVINA